MPAAKRKNIAGVQWIDSNDIAAIVDQRARDVLNISGRTFMRNRSNGKYAKLDADECPGIVELALVAPTPKKANSSARKKSSRSR